MGECLSLESLDSLDLFQHAWHTTSISGPALTQGQWNGFAAMFEILLVI